MSQTREACGVVYETTWWGVDFYTWVRNFGAVGGQLSDVAFGVVWVQGGRIVAEFSAGRRDGDTWISSDYSTALLQLSVCSDGLFERIGLLPVGDSSL